MIQTEALRDYIARYRHKASLLSRIHSDLAKRNSRWDLGHTFAIVTLTGLITFFGFTGSDRIFEIFGTAPQQITEQSTRSSDPSVASTQAQENATQSIPQRDSTIRKSRYEFWFNLSVLLLFIASLLNLIFRWKDKYTSHFSGVVKLRKFIGWLDEITLLQAADVGSGTLREIRKRYESIIEALPPNSDADYARAKKGMPSTNQSERPISSCDGNDEQLVFNLISRSPVSMEVLRVAKDYSTGLWLGGGSVRTMVWNYLTGRSEDIQDYDIVYFDSSDLDPDRDSVIEEQLKDMLPRTVRVSVKNQARMHLVNNEPARSSLEDAIRSWPECATAMAFQLTDSNELKAFAPYGYGDMLDLVVRPTPYHASNPTTYQRRIKEKQWATHWPELEIRGV